MTQPPVVGPAELADVLGRLAAVDRLLVCCDYDGTLSPIVSDPAAAVPVPAAPALLGSLAELPGTSVAVVSGRELAVLGPLSGMPGSVTLVGSHGTEFEDGFAGGFNAEQQELRDRIEEEVRPWAEAVPGAAVEAKPASIAVHVRNAPEAAGQSLLDRVEEGPGSWPGVHITHGKAVIELAVLDADKGSAVLLLRKSTRSSAVLFLGDDVTDERAFAVLGPSDVGIKVGEGPTRAGLRIADPQAAVELLAELRDLRAAGGLTAGD